MEDDAGAGAGPANHDDEFVKAGLSKLDQVANKVATTGAPPRQWWSNQDAMTISSVVLLFGFLVIVFSGCMAMRKIERDTIMKVVLIPMVIMSAVFLVVAGYSDKQVAPTMGLLGTIVGYVLGSARSPKSAHAAPSLSGPAGPPSSDPAVPP